MIFNLFSNWLSKVWPVQKINTVKLSKKNASNELIKYGEDMANAKRDDEALTLFDKAIEIDPNNDMAWGDKALILDKKGQPEEALISFSIVFSINPNNSITWHNKGLTLLRLRKFKESIECFDTALKINGNYAKVWYNKGRAFDLLGEKSRYNPAWTKGGNWTHCFIQN